MNSIEDVIDRLEEFIDTCKPVPFTDSIRVNRKEIEDLIYELKLTIPTALRDADDIVENCDNYISSAKNEADMIVSDAKMEADRLVSEHEVYVRAVDASDRQKEMTLQEIDVAIGDATKHLTGILDQVYRKVNTMNNTINEEFRNTYQSLDNYVQEVSELRDSLKG